MIEAVLVTLLVCAVAPVLVLWLRQGDNAKRTREVLIRGVVRGVEEARSRIGTESRKRVAKGSDESLSQQRPLSPPKSSADPKKPAGPKKQSGRTKEPSYRPHWAMVSRIARYETTRSFPDAYETAVAGVAYRQREVRRVRRGDRVSFEREPGNPHDPTAVRCIVRGKQVGYIRGEESPLVTQAIQEGATLDGIVYEVSTWEKDGRPMLGLAIIVAFNTRIVELFPKGVYKRYDEYAS